MVVGSMAVMRVWNLRGVMVVDGGCAGGVVVFGGGCLEEDKNGVVRGVVVEDEGGGCGCLAEDKNGVVRDVVVDDEGGSCGVVLVVNAVTTGRSVSSGPES